MVHCALFEILSLSERGPKADSHSSPFDDLKIFDAESEDNKYLFDFW